MADNEDTDDSRRLALDETLIVFTNNASSGHKLFVWKQFTQCFKCPLVFWEQLEPKETKPLKVTTNYELRIAITDQRPNDINYWTLSEESVFCQNSYSLLDQSKHVFTINGGNDYKCQIQETESGRNNIWPIVGAVLIYVIAAVLFYGGRRLFYRWRERQAAALAVSSPNESPIVEMRTEQKDDKRRKRLKSLDCFRGITILMMIFVNLGAGNYENLDHAAWDGFNFADIIFPWFIFIMGTTMAISFKSIVIRQKQTVSKIYYNIVKRSFNLFVIGLMLNSKGSADFRTLRIPGVLQRFGITYLVVGSSHVLSLLVHKGELFGALRIHQLVDIIPFWPEWIVMSLMAVLHFALTFGWQFSPICPQGYIGPGGLYDNMTHVHCTGGVAAYIDKWVLGDKHIYGHFTGDRLYDPNHEFSLRHDPEGILGTTTSIILTFLGLQIGKILIAYPNPKQRISRWLVWGLLLGSLSALFAATETIPINKNLWSFSFICLTSSAACFAISLLYYLIDVLQIWPNGQPFHYPGMNSILLYIGHEITADMIPWSFNVDESSHVGPLARNLVAVTVWFVISVVLAEKGFFLTI
ncbi:heparan-alpha-glucosaminide N-acetyltransferase-like [Oppia nitens]|uniref:heparan-alpha-glucosaminide N-acetyltransferase-like n=1 Tax=Oppia nitens TaxID=1686743 RepID=UPI0023DB56F6|nr:heparan-alpha-glucosaminide N-acetyltransferase-like [Oppia nitens]